MLGTLHRWLDRRRESRISKNFESAIASYRREILVSLTLDLPPEAELLQRRRNRAVYRDAARVWKFYRATQRGFARNFRAAASLLEARQIAAPKILYADTSKASKDKFGLSLLLMERIEGVSVAGHSTDEILADLGRLLAAIHEIKSPFWGDCIRQHGSPFAAEYFVNSLEAEMRPVNEWLRGFGEPALAPPSGAWKERASRIRPNN
ncbi:phosphotransferase, partial [Candidatus Sumerlaeota bacterium]|nr:phosphotransferase [Candidatus Sumerlaeota bacterium]